jgi:hypothetical protein
LIVELISRSFWFSNHGEEVLGHPSAPQINALTRPQAMSENNKQPTHRAYALLERKNSAGEADTFWLNIGSVFPHKDGKGYNVLLDALPIDGKLSIREIKADEDEPPQPQRKAYKR